MVERLIAEGHISREITSAVLTMRPLYASFAASNTFGGVGPDSGAGVANATVAVAPATAAPAAAAAALSHALLPTSRAARTFEKGTSRVDAVITAACPSLANILATEPY